MTYFDTSALVGALLQTHPRHRECLALFEQTRERITCAHALAETFSTLTASYKIPNEVAAPISFCASVNSSAVWSPDFTIS